VEIEERFATHLAPDEGRAYRAPGGLVVLKVTAEETGGAYSLFEEIVRPREGTPARIVHREDGCLYVVEGELEFLAGEEVLRVGPGALVYVPRGTVHGFTNVGEGEARVLNLVTPGGTHERFLEEIEDAAAPDPEVAARYGIEILPTREPSG
jgi:mannose-6-phosphate isomerase-like protein (cupin superfamily)